MKDTTQVRLIMGNNFCDAEEWTFFYEADFSKRQLRQITEFPWSKDILMSTCPLCGGIVKDCHAAFWGLEHINGKPLTILKFQKFHPDVLKQYPVNFQPQFTTYAPNAWFSKEKFAKKTAMDPRWYLLHINIIQRFLNKTYDEQMAMLPAEYEVPSAVAEIAKDLLIFRKTGICATNPGQYNRCSDLTSDNRNVFVGIYRFTNGPSIDLFWAGDRYCYVGIAASRKLLN